MESWHYNNVRDSSLIKEMTDMIDEDKYMVITMFNNDTYIITPEDTIQIGAYALLISTDEVMHLLNTNYIIDVTLNRKKQV